MNILEGTNASIGIGIGAVLVVEEPELEYESRTIAEDGRAAEKERFHAAVEGYVAYTQAQADAMVERVGEKEAEILTGHIAMIADPFMQGEMDKLIDAGTCAEDAVSQVCDNFAAMFEASGDELTMQRATDVRDVKGGVLAELLNKRPVDIGSVPQGTVLVNSVFVLTRDGKLYYKGSKFSTIIEACTTFTQIYPDKYFLDIEATSNTLAALIRE